MEKRILLVMSVLIIGILIPIQTIACDEMEEGLNSFHGGMGLFGWVFGALSLITMILLITWLIKQLQNSK